MGTPQGAWNVAPEPNLYYVSSGTRPFLFFNRRWTIQNIVLIYWTPEGVLVADVWPSVQARTKAQWVEYFTRDMGLGDRLVQVVIVRPPRRPKG
jgi:hypothetical protein